VIDACVSASAHILSVCLHSTATAPPVVSKLADPNIIEEKTAVLTEKLKQVTAEQQHQLDGYKKDLQSMSNKSVHHNSMCDTQLRAGQLTCEPLLGQAGRASAGAGRGFKYQRWKHSSEERARR
jgi:hypothetical protein